MGITDTLKKAATSAVDKAISSSTGVSNSGVSGANYRAMDSFTDTNMVETDTSCKVRSSFMDLWHYLRWLIELTLLQ